MRPPQLSRILLALSCLSGVYPAAAQEGSPADRLIDLIVAKERALVARMKLHRPILETYLQETTEGENPEALPTSDHYVVGRLDMSDGAGLTEFGSSEGFQKRRRGSRLVFSAPGFAQMLLVDAEDFDRRTYDFDYLRREFVGELRCLVFDVRPKEKKESGRFIGRIWVEDQDYRLVRFNGTYTQSKAAALFFHFDSWRVPLAKDFWAPAFVYVEDANPLQEKNNRVRFKGQTRLWGYQPARSLRAAELTSILVSGETPVRDRSESTDVSPLESQRSWQRQAEENVIQRLEHSGLLAPKGEVDKVLNTVVNNLMVTNDIGLDVQCRVLLTTPLETFSIGNTIVISRGLLDVLPDESSLAMVLSDELAHIVLGHRTETMFAFSDQTMFAEREILKKLRLERTPLEIEAAGKKAVQVLSRSPYKEQLGNAGLFLRAVGSRAARLPNLIAGNLGNRLASGETLVRLTELANKAPALEERKIEQIAALPLGSRVKLDPWTNQISLSKTKPVALLTPAEKMPFQVTPFVIHLTRLPEAPAPPKTPDR